MEHGLAGGRSVVEDETELAIRTITRDLLRDCHHLGKRCGIACGKFSDIRIRCRLRDHENVQRSLRGNIWERDDAIGLGDDLDRNLPRDDLAEHGFFCHALSLPPHTRAVRCGIRLCQTGDVPHATPDTDSPEATAGNSSAGGRLPSRRRLWASLLGLPLIIVIVIFGIPLANPLFPSETITSCTFEDRTVSERRSGILPRQHSDCGSFISQKSVVCTASPKTELSLTIGSTFDLIVRGPRLTPFTAPVIVSAQVSATQKLPDLHEDPAEAQSDIPAVQELAKQFSPEVLRAFDYEQPPDDPQCETGRSVMTSQGIQYVSPTRAEQLLTPPEGTVPADPKLACRGFQCGESGR